MFLNRVRSLASWSAITILTLTAATRANPIPTLFNTGVDAVGNLLSGGATDPHYALISSPDPAYPGPSAFVVNDNGVGYVSGPYIFNGPNSKWIAPRADNAESANGSYVYRTTFDLTGFDPATAHIGGQWAMDDAGVDILINGASTGISRPDGINFYFFVPFTINQGFHSGINTLDFIIFNSLGSNLNPTALRVELSGTATPVPEPAGLLLLGSGLIGMLGRIRSAGLITRRRIGPTC